MKKFINWTITVLTATALIAAYKLGFIDYLLEIDKSFLSLGILGITMVSSLFMSIAHLLGKAGDAFMDQMEYVAGALPSVGMVGTIIGLMFIIKGGIPDPQQLLIGVGTALTTTLTGIIGSLILLQQLTILDMEHEKET